MKARWLLVMLLPRAASAEEAQPRDVTVDFAALPRTDTPSVAAPEKGATGTAGFDVKPDKAPRARRGKARRPRSARVTPPRSAQVKPAGARLVHLSSPGGTEATQDDAGDDLRVDCNDAALLRREELVRTADGARLQLDDVRVGNGCKLIRGASSSVPLAPIAWEDGKPWLYAARGESSVTFVLPEASLAGQAALVGVPVTVRGAFTRVTLPLGSWGSAWWEGDLPALSFEARAKSDEASPIHLILEVNQATGDPRPTVLVHVRSAPPEPVSAEE